MSKDSYVPPTVTVDTVIFQMVNGKLSVLLIERAKAPFKGRPALPGGYVNANDTILDAVKRVVSEETGLVVGNLDHIEQLYTFDSTGIDPRGPAVTVAYMALGKNNLLENSPHLQNPKFYPLNKLPDLAYDHATIIKYAHERLASKITYTNAVFALLPRLFTLTQLQLAYENILGRSLDKRNFRKKYLSLGLIEPTDDFHLEGAHRPAKLYKFRSQELVSLSRSFD